jgi:ABC-type transport system involved in multi-copper enzyme maturation permease subunit
MKNLHLIPKKSVNVLGALVFAELRSICGSPAVYFLASLICLLTVFLSRDFLRTFHTESVVISSDPLADLQVISVVITGLGLGLRAATAVSWEREHHTLNVLLSTPVTISVFILSKLVREALAFVWIFVIYLCFLAVLTWSEGIGFKGADLSDYERVFILVTPVVGTGLLISAITRTVRTSVIIFLVVVLALLTAEGAYRWLALQPASQLSLALLYVREWLAALTRSLTWISPVSYLLQLFRLGSPSDLGVSGATLCGANLYTVVMALASILVTSNRGVAP